MKKPTNFHLLALAGLGLTLWLSLPRKSAFNDFSVTVSGTGEHILRRSPPTSVLPPDGNRSFGSGMASADHDAIGKAESVARGTNLVGKEPVVFEQFLSWSRRYAQADQELKESELVEGRRLAEERRPAMKRLMKESPGKALRLSVPLDIFHHLPADLQPLVEEPFSVKGDFEVIYTCGIRDAANPDGVREHCVEFRTTFPDGLNAETFVYGCRRRTPSKLGVPLQGIRLDGVTALEESVLKPLSPTEATVAMRLYPTANPDPELCFATGEPISTAAAALAGGQVFLFRDTASLDKLNRELAELDVLPGPRAGSQALLRKEFANSQSGFDIDGVRAEVVASSAKWTLTKKRVFFIRADFPDIPGGLVSQAELANLLNGPVSQSIREMSYGKTWIEADVSAEVFRLDNESKRYLQEQYLKLLRDAEAKARQVYDLSDYDIIGVYFPKIGFSWGGRAGGSSQWNQAWPQPSLFVHEFGHNYGLGHSSAWRTSDGSVIGPGEHVEYGDTFDVMGGGSLPYAHYNPQAKNWLRWLPQEKVRLISTSGVYRVHRFDHSDAAAVQALQIPKAAGQFYWVGYRQNYADIGSVGRRAYIIWEYDRSYGCRLLDMTPSSLDGFADSLLLIGRTFTEPNGVVNITPIATGGNTPDEWLDVAVNLGPYPNKRAPTVTIMGPSTVRARTPSNFTATVSDAEGDALYYLGDFGEGLGSPGERSLSKRWLIGGKYRIDVTVTDMKGGIATATFQVEVEDPVFTWTRADLGTPKHLYDVLYANGGFVVAGEGVLLNSIDGTNWVSFATGSEEQHHALASDGFRVIAAGGNYDVSTKRRTGSVWISQNGVQWSRRKLPQCPELRGVACGNGLIVAVGEQGTVLVSTDDESWTSVTSGTTAQLNSVAFGNSVFVAVGYEGTVLTSADGRRWTNRTDRMEPTSTRPTLRRVLFDRGTFMAVGIPGIHLSRDDGANWSQALVAGGRPLMRDLAIGGGMYLGVGERSDDRGKGEWAQFASMDGLEWEGRAEPYMTFQNALAYGNGVFMSVGNYGTMRRSGAFHVQPSGWREWRDQNLSDRTQSGPLDDPDGDGQPNLMEFAFGTLPTSAKSVRPPVFSFEGGYPTLVIARSVVASGLRFDVDVSTSPTLRAWTKQGVEIISDAPDWLKVRLGTPANAFPQAFFRVQVTLVEE